MENRYEDEFSCGSSSRSPPQHPGRRRRCPLRLDAGPQESPRSARPYPDEIAFSHGHDLIWSRLCRWMCLRWIATTVLQGGASRLGSLLEQHGRRRAVLGGWFSASHGHVAQSGQRRTRHRAARPCGQLRPDGSLVFPPFGVDQYRPDVHATSYRCEASNSFGIIGSRDVRVTAAAVASAIPVAAGPQARRLRFQLRRRPASSPLVLGERAREGARSMDANSRRQLRKLFTGGSQPSWLHSERRIRMRAYARTFLYRIRRTHWNPARGNKTRLASEISEPNRRAGGAEEVGGRCYTAAPLARARASSPRSTVVGGSAGLRGADSGCDHRSRENADDSTPSRHESSGSRPVWLRQSEKRVK
ncbi:hypothetical protein MRX96_009770 [Rhipicephalus microplus]